VTTAAAPTATAPVSAPATVEAAPSAAPETPAPSEPLSAAQEGAKAASYKDRKAKALAIFAAGGKAPEAAAEAVADTVEAEAPPETPPAPETPAVDAKAETAAARALAALRKAEAENLRLKNEAKAELERERAERAAEKAEAAKLQKRLEAIAADPVAAIEAAGMSAEQFMREVATGKIKPRTTDDVLRDQVQDKLSPLEQRLADAEAKLKAREEAEAQERTQRETLAAREKNLGIVKSVVTADEYPITAALGAYDVILDSCYRDQTDNVAEQAAKFEAHQVALLEQLLSKNVLAALEKRSPKIRETVSALRGAAQSRQAAVSSGGPRVAARDVVSAPTTPVERPKTFAERRARAAAVLTGKLS
jgi:hypothetical protein